MKFGLGPKELGVTELKADAAREICFALGVPPMLLGIPGDNTYANYAEANRAFWRETVILCPHELEEIGAWLGALQGVPDLKLVPDTDDIPALASERRELSDMMNAAEFVTVNEKREALAMSLSRAVTWFLWHRRTFPLRMRARPSQAAKSRPRAKRRT